jgi:hypothetical protein
MLEHDFNVGLFGQTSPHVRFPIYRNNVSQALVGALRVRFPIVEQLVGPEFFSAMASTYAAECKPLSAVLIHYGASFADFIAAFAPASSLTYLAEVAHFENAWWHAYHAGEASPLEMSALTELAPEDWSNLKFEFHPTVKLFHCTQGAASIWRWHQTANNQEKLLVETEEFALLSRPHAEVEVRLIAADGFTFLSHLKSAKSLEAALGETKKNYPEFDLQSILGAVFQLEIITGITT